MRLKILTTILCALCFLAGCGESDDRGNITPHNQPISEVDYKVKFLFEVDGVKVYRFTDTSRYDVYFTVPSGEIYYEYGTRGRAKHTNKIQCINTKTKEE